MATPTGLKAEPSSAARPGETTVSQFSLPARPVFSVDEGRSWNLLEIRFRARGHASMWPARSNEDRKRGARNRWEVEKTGPRATLVSTRSLRPDVAHRSCRWEDGLCRFCAAAAPTPFFLVGDLAEGGQMGRGNCADGSSPATSVMLTGVCKRCPDRAQPRECVPIVASSKRERPQQRLATPVTRRRD